MDKHDESFPSDVIKWMKKNANPQMALKLMQISKYFQHEEFPYFVTKKIYSSFGIRCYTLDDKEHDFSTVEDIPKPIWITQWISLNYGSTNISQFLTKVAVCDIHELLITQQNLSFGELKFLTASRNIDSLELAYVEIENDDGSNVSLNEIIPLIPNAHTLSIQNSDISFTSTDENWPNLKKLELFSLSKEFNFAAFTNFIIKNQHIRFRLSFNDEVINEPEKDIIKIIENWNIENSPPVIEYYHQSEKINAKLDELME